MLLVGTFFLKRVVGSKIQFGSTKHAEQTKWCLFLQNMKDCILWFST